jgi:hypothetical protein
VTILIMFSWVEAPCGLVGRNQSSEEACCLHLRGVGGAAGVYKCSLNLVPDNTYKFK